jgi:hypothetical protein
MNSAVNGIDRGNAGGELLITEGDDEEKDSNRTELRGR